MMVTLLLFFLGAAMIGVGIHRYKGPVSVWYLSYGPATIGHSYFMIPIGLALILLSLATASIVDNKLKMPLVASAIVINILGLVLAPRLLKPTWLCWLEKEYGAIMPMLQREIQKTGSENWNRRINTQAELEEWINEVKQRRKQEAMGFDNS